MSFQQPKPDSNRTITCPLDKGDPKAEFVVSTAFPQPLCRDFALRFLAGARILSTGGEGSEKVTSLYRDIVKAGLQGIAGVYDTAGAVLTLNPIDRTLDILDSIRLPRESKEKGKTYDSLLSWLALTIWELNSDAEEEKKS